VLLPPLCERLATIAPGIRLHVRGYVHRDEAIRLLDDGRADVAIGVPPTRKAGRILWRPLFEDGFVCVMRKGHPAADRPLTLDRYLALSHILVSPEDDRFGIVDEAPRGPAARASWR
jgi:DNA-binding transcriptional LysR family regulator